MHPSRRSKNDNRNMSITKNTNFLSFFQDPISSLWVCYLPVAWVLYSLYLYLSSPHFFSSFFFLTFRWILKYYYIRRRRSEGEYLLRVWQAINFLKFQKKFVFFMEFDNANPSLSLLSTSLNPFLRLLILWFFSIFIHHY